jgi:lysyl-tRNA synthetase, class I
MPFLDKLAGLAVRYYQDFVKNTKQYRAPTAAEQQALKMLVERLKATIETGTETDAEALQTIVYAVGMASGYETTMRAWFQALYQVLLGQEEGPRFGSFIALYGVEEIIVLIEKMLQANNG